MLECKVKDIPSILNGGTLMFIRSAVLNELRWKSFSAGDGQVDQALAAYKLPITEYLLGYLHPVFEMLLGRKIVPTFSYCRIYEAGHRVEMHVDREEAEFTASVMIAASSPDASWDFVVEDGEMTASHLQRIGDCVLLNGAEVRHGRPPYEGKWCMTAILCYVSNQPEKARLFGDQSKLCGAVAARAQLIRQRRLLP